MFCRYLYTSKQPDTYGRGIALRVETMYHIVSAKDSGQKGSETMLYIVSTNADRIAGQNKRVLITL